MQLLSTYRNGNYFVDIFDDGTKIRRNNLDSLEPEFSESIDCKITDYCDVGCVFCYENSTNFGKHADILNNPFFDTIHQYTEIALGGGSPILHPDLIPFLEKLKSKNVLPSMTINQKHFVEKYQFIKDLVDRKLIYGVGVSVSSVNDELIDKLKKIPNAVVHVIAGIFNQELYGKLAGQNLKILILGYKDLGRGAFKSKTESELLTIESNMNWLKANLKQIMHRNSFFALCFDNLALDQLNVKDAIGAEKWESFYMGDDGSYTFFVDLVEGKFCKNSISQDRNDMSLFGNNIDTMFLKIKPKNC
jgi:hypothetical protein